MAQSWYCYRNYYNKNKYCNNKYSTPIQQQQVLLLGIIAMHNFLSIGHACFEKDECKVHHNVKLFAHLWKDIKCFQICDPTQTHSLFVKPDIHGNSIPYVILNSLKSNWKG